MTLTVEWLAAIDGTNALAATIEFSRHGLVQHVDPVDAARVAFEDADPVREFPSWPGKCHFEGKLWIASTGQHVPFESFWERAFLTSVDRTGDSVGMSSQPMWIRWRSPKRSYAPDYFGGPRRHRSLRCRRRVRARVERGGRGGSTPSLVTPSRR